MVLSKADHSFLRNVSWALKPVDLGRICAVLYKTSCLNLVLRKIFNQDSWRHCVKKIIYEFEDFCFVILILYTFGMAKMLKVQQMHVCLFSKMLSYNRLATCLWTYKEVNFWKQGLLCCLINLIDITRAVYSSHFTKLSIEINHWSCLLIVSVEPLSKNLFSIINSSWCLSSSKTPLNQGIFCNFIEKDSLAFHNILLEVYCLLSRSGESIDEVVLAWICNQSIY